MTSKKLSRSVIKKLLAVYMKVPGNKEFINEISGEYELEPGEANVIWQCFDVAYGSWFTRTPENFSTPELHS